jgi:putative endonuclease
MKGWMYILKCADESYYVGSTRNLKRRLAQHQAGEGANHTKKRLPVKLVYFELYPRVYQAFYREKQVQRWSRKKKEALINGRSEELKRLAECMNATHCKNYGGAGFDYAQPASVMDYVRAPSETDYAQPASVMDYVRPPSEMDYAQPDSEMDCAQPVGDMDNLQAASDLDPVGSPLHSHSARQC